MAKLNYKTGDLIDLPLDAAVDSGDFVAEGEALIGFAELDGDATAAGCPLKRKGEFFGAPKATGTAWVLGDRLSHNGTNFLISATLDIVATATAAALSGAAVGNVVLLPAPMVNPARLTAVEAVGAAAATEADLTTAEGRITTLETESATEADLTTAEGRITVLEGDSTIAYLGTAPVAVTGTATETVTQTATIPAGALEAGDTLVVTGGLVATSTTSTETVIGRLRIGGVTGPVIARTNAQDVANDDEAGMWGQVDVKTLGIATASEAGVVGFGAWDTAGTTFGSVLLATDALDTTAEITVVATVEASSTGESIIGSGLKVLRIRKSG